MSDCPIMKRMKDNYENRTRYFLPRRTYSIIRLDGKAWHSYTKSLKKPFDKDLIEDLDNAVIAIMPEIQGAVFAYIQSDEVSILLTDFTNIGTQAWFDGNIQKMASISASLLTAEFNKQRFKRFCSNPISGEKCITQSEVDNFVLGFFDSRIFTIPDPIEVYNYFVARNKDCARNSISMVAQANFSHKELHSKGSADMQEMLFQHKGINWAEYDQSLKNGRLVVKEEYWVPLSSTEGKSVTGEASILLEGGEARVKRTRWAVKPAPVFSKEPDVLINLIPKIATEAVVVRKGFCRNCRQDVDFARMAIGHIRPDGVVEGECIECFQKKTGMIVELPLKSLESKPTNPI